jgi:Flp pilus assembly protein TadD
MRIDVCSTTVVACLLSAGLLFCGCSAKRAGATRDDLKAGWSSQRAEIDGRMLSLLGSGEFEDAAALADSVLTYGFRDPRLLGQKAAAVGALGMRIEAIALYEEAILADYPGCENHLDFGVFLMRVGRTGRAVTELREAKQFCMGANRILVYRNLAVAYIKMERYEQALMEVDEGLRIGAKDPYLLGLKGMLSMDSNPALAESLLAAPAGSGLVEPEFLFQYGLLLLSSERPDQAVGVLAAASELKPFDLEIREALAAALRRAGRLEESERVFHDLASRGREVGLQLGRVLMEQERYDEALELLSTLAPTAEVLDRKAMCLFRLGRSDEALEAERRALEERPGWPVAMINLAVILAERGEFEEARALLERALEIDPENAAASVNLERLNRALER